jgi:hypothetical protein
MGRAEVHFGWDPRLTSRAAVVRKGFVVDAGPVAQV